MRISDRGPGTNPRWPCACAASASAVSDGHRQFRAGLGGEGWRFPGEVISHTVWLYFRFPLSLRMVEEMLAARGIDVSHETVRQWARKFGQAFANQIRRRLPAAGDKWHLDEVCLMIRLIRLLTPEPEDTRATEFYSAAAGSLSRPLL